MWLVTSTAKLCRAAICLRTVAVSIMRLWPWKVGPPPKTGEMGPATESMMTKRTLPSLFPFWISCCTAPKMLVLIKLTNRFWNRCKSPTSHSGTLDYNAKLLTQRSSEAGLIDKLVKGNVPTFVCSSNETRLARRSSISWHFRTCKFLKGSGCLSPCTHSLYSKQSHVKQISASSQAPAIR